MKLVFLGPPGAGKGTQAKSVCHKLRIAHVSTGDMLRREVDGGTELGIRAKVFMDEGALVPDELIIAMVANRIVQADCANGFLFDGFPRTITQAQALSEVTSLDAVVNITVADGKLIDRLCERRVCLSCGGTYRARDLGSSTVCVSCGGELIQREDDRPETIANRLRVYHEKTQPLEDFYSNVGLLINVEGDAPVNEVTKDILTALHIPDD